MLLVKPSLNVSMLCMIPGSFFVFQNFCEKTDLAFQGNSCAVFYRLSYLRIFGKWICSFCNNCVYGRKVFPETAKYCFFSSMIRFVHTLNFLCLPKWRKDDKLRSDCPQSGRPDFSELTGSRFSLQAYGSDIGSSRKCFLFYTH